MKTSVHYPKPPAIIKLEMTEDEWRALRCEIEDALHRLVKYAPRMEYLTLSALYAELEGAGDRLRYRVI